MICFIMTALSDSPKVHRHSLALTMWCFYIHNYLCLSKKCFLTRCKNRQMIRENSPRSLNHMATNFCKEVLVPRLSSNALWFDYGATATDTNMVVSVQGTLIRPWIETFPMTVASTRAWRPRAQVSKCGWEWGWCRCRRTPFFHATQLQSSHFSELIHPQISYLFTDYSISGDKSAFSCAHPKRLLISYFLPLPDIDTATRFINDRNQKIIITNQSVLLGMTFHSENEIIHAKYYR